MTRLQYQLHEIDTILGGLLVLPASPEILGSFIAAADDAPDELSTIAILTRLPPLPFVPTEHHGQLALMIRLAYAGDFEHGQQALAPLRALATPLADAVTAMHYRQMYAAEGAGLERVRVATRSTFLDKLDEHAAATIFERMQAQPSPMTAVQIRVLGGAMARIPVEASAFAHRDRSMMVTFFAGYQDVDQTAPHEAWVADSLASLSPAARGVHVSFLGEDGTARVHEAYPEDTYKRLARIKRRYDPANLFRVNQNIAPNGWGWCMSNNTRATTRGCLCARPATRVHTRRRRPPSLPRRRATETPPPDSWILAVKPGVGSGSGRRDRGCLDRRLSSGRATLKES